MEPSIREITTELDESSMRDKSLLERPEETAPYLS